MKSQRRHELQHNVLDKYLADTVAFFRKNGNYIAWGALLVAVIIFASVYLWNRHTAKIADIQARFAHLSSNTTAYTTEDRVKELTELANQSTDKTIAAKANLLLGDEYFSRVVLGSGLQADQRAELVQKAQSFYTTVTTEYGDQPNLVAIAFAGLGKLAENEKQFDKAKEYYDKAKEIAPADEPLARLVQKNIDRLASMKEPVAMATTMPADETSTKPGTTLPADETSTKPATTLPGTAPATTTAPATGAAERK